MWEATVNHARGCILGNKLYSYSIEEKGVVLVFDAIFQLVGANIGGLYQPLSGLSAFQKVCFLSTEILSFILLSRMYIVSTYLPS